jgi:hypothetical protein
VPNSKSNVRWYATGSNCCAIDGEPKRGAGP